MASLSPPSLRDHTSRIRHLDSARAREIVALFRRPIPATGPTVFHDRHDTLETRDHLVAATKGEVVLGRLGTATAPASNTAPRHPTHAEMIAAIARIAQAGEDALGINT